MRPALLLLLSISCAPAPSSGGGGGSGGGAAGGGSGGGAAYPTQVKLHGTIERSARTYDSSGHLVTERTSSGSFSGISTGSDLEAVTLTYEFAQPFMVTGTQSRFDITLGSSTCTLDISGSDQSTVTLTVGIPSSGNVARFSGDMRTTTTGTCSTGATVDNSFDFDLPGLGCPDPALKTVSGQSWLAVDGDPHTGYQLEQDVTCDGGTVKLSASVEAL